MPDTAEEMLDCAPASGHSAPDIAEERLDCAPAAGHSVPAEETLDCAPASGHSVAVAPAKRRPLLLCISGCSLNIHLLQIRSLAWTSECGNQSHQLSVSNYFWHVEEVKMTHSQNFPWCQNHYKSLYDLPLCVCLYSGETAAECVLNEIYPQRNVPRWAGGLGWGEIKEAAAAGAISKGSDSVGGKTLKNEKEASKRS